MIKLDSNAQQVYNSIPNWRYDTRDLYFEVCERLTIVDVFEKYTSARGNRYRRIPCPIHNGKNLNFSYNDKYYTCFKCGASGDVISLAKELCGCENRFYAAKMLDADFGLGLLQNNKKSLAQHLAIEQRRIKRQQEEYERKKAKMHFQHLMLMREAADLIIEGSAPTDPDAPFPEVFSNAINFRTRIQAEIEDIIEVSLC